MIKKRKTHAAGSIFLLAGALSLLAVTGCACPPSADDESPKGQAASETEAPDAVADAAAADSAVSKGGVQPDEGDSGKQQTESAAVAKNAGPGDGPPPQSETRKKVEEMEQSLAPLKAVSTIPTS